MESKKSRSIELLQTTRQGVRPQRLVSLFVVGLMLTVPLSGCFASDSASVSPDNLEITFSSNEAGFFQDLTFEVTAKMSVFIPYLLKDPNTQFIQNSTVLDLTKGESVTLSILTPPRTETMLFMVGDSGRENWPIRNQEESWDTWLARGGDLGGLGDAIMRIPAGLND